MGLLTTNKKLCPICGSPTSRILSTRVENRLLCKTCASKIDLPDGTLDAMSLDSFRRYLAFYDENQALRDQFCPTYRHDFSFLGGSLLLDFENRLLRLKDDDTALVLQADMLETFRILEDGRVVFAREGSTLMCYQSTVPARLAALAPQVAQFNAQRQEFAWRENMTRMQLDYANENGESLSPDAYDLQPRFTAPAPLQKFQVTLSLQHPYWRTVRWEVDAPRLDANYPNINAYQQDYEAKVDALHTLASRLMQLVCPGAREVYTAASHSDAEERQLLRECKAFSDAIFLAKLDLSGKKLQRLSLSYDI